jgi:hypothetical protein
MFLPRMPSSSETTSPRESFVLPATVIRVTVRASVANRTSIPR